MKTLSLIVLLAVSASALAGSARPIQDNEDLRFIRTWQMKQKAAALAEELQLSADQAATLRRVKGSVEAIEAEYKPRLEELDRRTDQLAAEVRGRIEREGTLTEADRAALEDLRSQQRELRQQKRTRIKSAAAELEGFLTEAQVAVLRERAHEHRERIREHAQHRGQEMRGQLREQRGQLREQRAHLREQRAQLREQRGGEHSEQRQKRVAKRAKDLAARMLLSDAFIDAID